jgi:hypothetical protein
MVVLVNLTPNVLKGSSFKNTFMTSKFMVCSVQSRKAKKNVFNHKIAMEIL